MFKKWFRIKQPAEILHASLKFSSFMATTYVDSKNYNTLLFLFSYYYPTELKNIKYARCFKKQNSNLFLNSLSKNVSNASQPDQRLKTYIIVICNCTKFASNSYFVKFCDTPIFAACAKKLSSGGANHFFPLM